MKMELKQTNTVLRGNDLSQSASWFGRRNKKAMKGARVLVVALAVLAGLLTQVVRAQSAYSLAQYQTPFRFTDGDPSAIGQGGRGTCWAFAGVAALEAAYKRKYGIELDLSEQYTFHMGKVMELQARTPENNTSLVGFQGSSDIVHHLSRFAIPEERFAPYLTNTQMTQLQAKLGVGDIVNNPTQTGYDTFEFSEEHIPTAARWNAKYWVTDYDRVANPSNTGDLEQILLQNHEIVANFNLRRNVIDALNWDYNPAASVESHVLLIIGYDRDLQVFLAKNSWGEKDFVRLSYNLVSNCITDAYYIKDVADPNWPAQKKARYLGIRTFEEVYSNSSIKGTLVIRRFTDLRADDPNAQTKLGTLYTNNGAFDVNGYFTDDGDGIVFSVNLNSSGIPMLVEYTTGFWAWVDQNYTGDVQKGTDWQPFKSFTTGAYVVPRYGTVFVQPGSYAAVGTYNKPMTIKAPLGGVILGNGN